MRLLHAESLCFEEFFDSDAPPYAILSHRWEGKEVAFHEFEAAKKRDGPEFSKIKNFCSFVSRQPGPYVYAKPEWVWVDTCCIDKKSSAELSEAINSMFQWYKRAAVCYAYLSTVNARPGKVQEQQFRENPWFTRGWTLQELIAPREVCFLDCQWNIIGRRTELAAQISAITGVEEDYLRKQEPVGGRKSPAKASIATRMSWVSKRMTSRREDMAYCLLGIFDINMPLLYGEGEKAFMRLQLEIIRNSDDESIFAWTVPDDMRHYRIEGMLAPWPTCFASCGDIREIPSTRPPYSMTNKGLEFRIPAYSSPHITVPLNCSKFDGVNLRVTIKLFDLYDNVGHRYSGNGTEFEKYTESVMQGKNTHVIYIPQGKWRFHTT